MKSTLRRCSLWHSRPRLCVLGILVAATLFVSALPVLAQSAATAPAPASSTAPAAAQADKGSIEYFAVMLNGKKVGYAVIKRQVLPAQVVTTTFFDLTIGRAETAMRVQMQQIDTETPDGVPLRLESEQRMGGMAQKVDGVVTFAPQDPASTAPAKGALQARITSAGQTTSQSLPWPAGALLSEGQRLLTLKMGLAEGTKYTVKMYDVSSLSAMDLHVTVGKTEPLDLLGRVVDATRIESALETIGGELNQVTYVDPDSNTLKMIAPIGGLKVEMLACTKDAALTKPEVFDAFGTLVLQSPTDLGDLSAATSATYVLASQNEAKLSLPTLDSQSVGKTADGRYVLTVSRPADPGDFALPYQGDDAAALKALEGSRYVQSHEGAIQRLAARARGDAKTASQAAKKLEEFVSGYITKKDLSVGYASALEVLKSREGDCTEHAVLLAALCQASGLPARVCVGFVYVPEFEGQKNIFGPHAWVEVYMGKKWVGLDAALRGWNVGHLALASGNGNPEDFFGMVNTMGNFKIEKAQAQ